MLVKFMPKGRCGIDYVLGAGRKDDTRNPTVIAGDADQCRALVAGLNFKNRLTSCVLSYEMEITPAEAARDIASFEQALLPGLDTTAWDRLWVRHTEFEKDPITKQVLPGGRVRTALHCIIPNVHLPSGKRLQPFWKGADLKRIEAWQELTNAAHGYASPKDPARRRDLVISSRLPANVAAIKAQLNANVIAAVKNGEIITHETLVAWLQKQDFKLTRPPTKSISLRHPALKKN